MKTIGLTLRVDNYPPINERRDAIDQRWNKLLQACGLNSIYISNQLRHNELLTILDSLDGVILTGGNSLANLGGDAPERDQLEKLIIDYAVQHSLPILGVCRGMQMLQQYFDVKLEQIADHIGTTHLIDFMGQTISVNSYHQYGAVCTSPQLKVIARSDDGVIEAISHIEHPFIGLMWHPERETPFTKADLDLIKQHFQIPNTIGVQTLCEP